MRSQKRNLIRGKDKRTISISVNDYKEEGIYLILPDSTQLMLTRTNIKKIAEEFWNDPAKISIEVRKAGEFQRCEICPKRGLGGLCDAIRPIFPFLEHVDKYVSYDKITAIYSAGKGNILHIANTTMQEALKYVSALSLLVYCQNGRKYRKYFYGINPLMTGKEVAGKSYLNMHWLHNGNKEEIDRVVKNLTDELKTTSQNQVKRLNMVCKNDAFMNAFVNTQIATEFLSMGIDKSLNQSFEDFEKVEKEITKYD